MSREESQEQEPDELAELDLDAIPVVRQLSDELANQIAAGEVVERPSSVVKELVENAVDAGATWIEIELEEGGADLIRVRDDGCGMRREDAELAIRRHATSKIQERADLFAISSMGFRGEALPSIASVSRFSLVTKPHRTIGGTRVLVDGGNLRLIEDFGCPPGTEITVKELFFNTPARRKFLKTRSTEMKHAVEAVHRLALPRPEVAFRLVHNGREVLNLPAVKNHQDRIYSVFGGEDALLLYRSTVAEQDGVEAWGFIGAPQLSRRNSTGIWTFVNGRYVRDSSLMAAIKVAYRGMMERGRQPVCVMFLSVPAHHVDVNVHPTKVEVRFEDASAVFRATRRAIVQTLADTPWVPGSEQTQDDTSGDGEEEDSDASTFGVEQRAPRVYKLGETRNFEADESLQGSLETHPAPPAVSRRERNTNVSTSAAQQRSRDRDGSKGADVPQGDAHHGAVTAESPPEGYFARLHFVGQIHGTFLLCSDSRGLVVVDMHAAHERITFEDLRLAWRGRETEIQSLMIPEMLSLNSLRAAVLSEHLEFFATLGFEIEPFGGNDFALKGVPAFFQNRSVKPLLIDTIDELGERGESDRVAEAIDNILLRMACHGSLRSGDMIHQDEAASLFAQLDAVDFGANCPHGRPVFFRMSVEELETRFSRR